MCFYHKSVCLVFISCIVAFDNGLYLRCFILDSFLFEIKNEQEESRCDLSTHMQSFYAMYVSLDDTTAD